MAVATPEWLTKHDGELACGQDGQTCVVYLAGEPQYALFVLPAAGKLTCEVKQTNNGKRLESAAVYPTIDEAARGGLEDLRKALGW
jgi:hypothetical protein